MSKQKPESLTERQHFLLYEYKSTWFKLTSRKDAQDNQGKRYKLADLTRDYWQPKDRVYVLLVWLLLCCSLTLPGQILYLIWERGWFNPRDPTSQPVTTCVISIAAVASTNGLAPGVMTNGMARKPITAARRKFMRVFAAAGGIWPNPPSHLSMANLLPAG